MLSQNSQVFIAGPLDTDSPLRLKINSAKEHAMDMLVLLDKLSIFKFLQCPFILHSHV